MEALGKFLPDVDRPNEGVFAWQDEDETWLALRYDLTAPLARVFAQHRMSPADALPALSGRAGLAQREAGAGAVPPVLSSATRTPSASASVAADAEMCAMLGEALEAAGIARGDYVIRINNRKVLNGVLEAAGRARSGRPGGATRRGAAS